MKLALFQGQHPCSISMPPSAATASYVLGQRAPISCGAMRPRHPTPRVFQFTPCSLLCPPPPAPP